MSLAHRKRSPGRCDRCGCMMVMVRLRDWESERVPASRIGWQCLVCDRTVDVETMAHRQERIGLGGFGDARRRREKVLHA